MILTLRNCSRTIIAGFTGKLNLLFLALLICFCNQALAADRPANSKSNNADNIGVSGPTITAGAVTGIISACAGNASASPNIIQFAVSGSGLYADIMATAPIGFEVSLATGSGYGSSITLVQTGGVVNTAVYVRSAASASGSISGNVSLTSAGAASQNVAVTGVVNALPVVNPVPNQTIFNGSIVAAINFPGTGNSANWVNDTPGIGLAASGTGDIAGFTANNTGSSPVTATVTVSPLSTNYAYIGCGTVIINRYLGSETYQPFVAVVNTITNTIVKNISLGTSTEDMTPYVTVSPDGSRAYAVLYRSQTTFLINTSSNIVIPGNGTMPSAISPDGDTQYLLNFGGVAAYHVATGTYSRFNFEGSPVKLLLNNDGSRLFIETATVTNNGGHDIETETETDGIVAINTANGEMVSALSIPSIGDAMIKSPDGSKIYALSGDTPSLFVWDAATGVQLPTITLNHIASFGGFSPDGSRLYLLNSGSTISVINTITATQIASIAVGNDPRTALISHDGSRLYAINYSANSVSVVNTVSNAVIATLPVGSNPYGGYLTPDGSKLYVSNSNGASLTAIKTATNTVITTVPVGSGPGTITGTADGNWIYVTAGNAVSAINTSTNAVTKLLTGDNPSYLPVNMFTNGTGCSGAARSFTITVNPVSSADADLSGLALSTPSLNPIFSSTTTDYTATITPADIRYYGQPAITPTTHAAGATIKVNGVAVTSGSQCFLALKAGNNPITIVVTAADGTTTKTYRALVYLVSNNPYLSSVALSSGTLSPSFSETEKSYTAIVGDAVSTVTLTPIVNYPLATVYVNGIKVASGTASANIPLSPGVNTITTEVVAEDNATVKIYTIKVTRTSPAVNLAGLTVSNGTLSPAFVADSLNYTDVVSSTTASVTVTPTVNTPGATVKVNGAVVTSGGASAAIPLKTGVNTITVVVTAVNGIATETYTIAVIRLSSNPYLSGLALSSGTLSPSFSETRANYTATVPGAVSSIKVTPQVSFPAATVTVNGGPATSGIASAAIPITPGSNTITVVVTAQDGVTHKTYTLTVTRQKPAVCTLSGLTFSTGSLSPAFATATLNYNLTVGTTVTSTNITPTATDPLATVYVNGIVKPSGSPTTLPLATGIVNYISVMVVAQDGVTNQTYYITVPRLSNNAYLASLALSGGALSPAFTLTNGVYTAAVTGATSSITVTPTLNNPHGSITVNGTAVTSGTASASIPLAVGDNTITTLVTAEDGVTIKHYRVTVTRPSNNAYLSSLVLSSGTLSPAFAMATGSYTASVGNATSSITVTPTLNNPHGSITVNGTAVTSGTATGAIALSVGDNTISTVVTAQDGVTHKTYTVTVTRAMSGFNSLYLPGGDGANPLSFSLNQKVEPNNILSPNGDGINDIWVVKNIAYYPNNVVTVFDREGQVVFTKKGYTNDWTGTYRGSVLNEGTYYYSVDLGNGTVSRGFITVVSH